MPISFSWALSVFQALTASLNRALQCSISAGGISLVDPFLPFPCFLELFAAEAADFSAWMDWIACMHASPVALITLPPEFTLSLAVILFFSFTQSLDL